MTAIAAMKVADTGEWGTRVLPWPTDKLRLSIMTAVHVTRHCHDFLRRHLFAPMLACRRAENGTGAK